MLSDHPHQFIQEPRSRSNSEVPPLSPRRELGVDLIEDKRREEALAEVYREFDLDGSGEVGFAELLLLGQTRRKLGQKTGAWTADMYRHLLDKIGTNSDGDVSEHNFVRYFSRTLPNEPASFDQTVEQFLECARACRCLSSAMLI